MKNRLRIVQLNSTCGSGSTGNICLSISRKLNEENIENYILYSLGHSKYSKSFKYSNTLYTKIQAMKSKLFGNYGYNSLLSTLILIKNLDRISPNIIHIHNIHSHDCNLELLFKYLFKRKIRIIWTFHDCWAITGGCTHFIQAKCDKWKNGCGGCGQKELYSFLYDKSRNNWLRKKRILEESNITIVCPSNWLSQVVKDSIAKNNNTFVINNGINRKIFKKQKSDYFKDKGIEKKHKLLGVAYNWNEAKGLNDFLILAKTLSNDYQIILVGTDADIEKKLPNNIIAIRKTNNQHELAEIYNSVDILINPTKEDNYPTTLMESISCGTPVISYDVGGCKEIVNKKFGHCIQPDINLLINTIYKTMKEIDDGKYENISFAASVFDETECYNKYIQLYKELE